MRSSIIGVLVILVAMSAPGVMAAGIQQGTIELVPNVSFSHAAYSSDGDDVGSITNLRVAASIGYFVTRLVEVTGGLAIDHSSFSEEGSSSFDRTDTGLLVGVLFNFATDAAFVPFVGAGVGVVMHGGDVGNADNATIHAPRVEGGIRFLVGNSASINLSVAYEHQIDALGVDDLSSNVIFLGVGLSAFVQGGPEG